MSLEDRVKEALKKPLPKIKKMVPPISWEGKWTKELSDLFEEHNKLFGLYPDEYDDVEANDYTYDDLVKILKMCIKYKTDIDDYTTFLVLIQVHKDVQDGRKQRDPSIIPTSKDLEYLKKDIKEYDDSQDSDEFINDLITNWPKSSL